METELKDGKNFSVSDKLKILKAITYSRKLIKSRYCFMTSYIIFWLRNDIPWNYCLPLCKKLLTTYHNPLFYMSKGLKIKNPNHQTDWWDAEDFETHSKSLDILRQAVIND